MKYQIYHGGKKIEPPSNINTIYHGGTVIWNRDRIGITISVVFSSSKLNADYRFTKSGLIAPRVVSPGEYTFFDIRGNKTIRTFRDADFPTEHEVTGGKLLYGTYPIYVFDDSPYSVLTESGLRDIDTILSDTPEQWQTVTDETSANIISNSLTKRGILLKNGFADGIYPVRTPLGGIDGRSDISELCYCDGQSIITDSGFVVLSVCVDVLLCCENLSVDGVFLYGDITEREKNGNLIRSISEHVFICNIDTGEPNAEIIGDYVALSHDDAYVKTEIYNVKTGERETTLFNFTPYNVCYSRGTYFHIDTSARDNILYSHDLKAFQFVDLVDSDGNRYEIQNIGAPGCMYSNGRNLFLICKNTSTGEFCVLEVTNND